MMLALLKDWPDVDPRWRRIALLRFIHSINHALNDGLGALDLAIAPDFKQMETV